MTHTATILIVDDEIQNRKLLEALLRPEGYLTLTAASGPEALVSATEHAPDLILLDIMMPGMDGYQVATQLKANPATSRIPIIMVSALVDRDSRVAGLNAGAEEFLTKPVDRAELWIRVRNHLRFKEYRDFLQDQARVLQQKVEARTADLQRICTAMDAAADAILLVSRSTMRFVEVNATACKMLGYTRDELMLLGPVPIQMGKLEELERLYDRLIAGDTINELMETTVRRKDDSELQVEVHRQVMRSNGEWIIVKVVRDISARKHHQEEILRLNSELEERVRQRTAQLQVANHELEAFSYSVAHDLRAPLNTIDGFCSLLSKEISEVASERSRHYLDRIRASAVQMGELIDAMLMLAQVSRSSLVWEKLDLSSIAETALNGCREREPDRVVQADIEPGLVVHGDPRLLRQVFENLIGNAWKFSGQNPQTSIAFKREAGPNGQIMYAIRDKGAGFDMAYSGKLFGVFQRLHTVAEFAGTGIGLVIVHRIITRHGGRIWAESVPGMGATFYFTLGEPPDGSSAGELSD